MGDLDVKTYQNPTTRGRSLQRSFPLAVLAAVSASRDTFREILGSEPVVEALPNDRYNIATYGAGDFKTVGQFGLKELPGCCGVAVFFEASVTQDFRGKGLGRLFLKLRERAARLAGYALAQATVLNSNKPEKALLESEGWKESWTFPNTRTGNKVVVYFKALD